MERPQKQERIRLHYRRAFVNIYKHEGAGGLVLHGGNSNALVGAKRMGTQEQHRCSTNGKGWIT